MDADCGLAPLGPSMCRSGVSCWLISLRVFFTPQRHSMNSLLFSLKTHPIWSSCLFTTAQLSLENLHPTVAMHGLDLPLLCVLSWNFTLSKGSDLLEA